jgi:hypothetical protein
MQDNLRMTVTEHVSSTPELHLSASPTAADGKHIWLNREASDDLRMVLGGRRCSIDYHKAGAKKKTRFNIETRKRGLGDGPGEPRVVLDIRLHVRISELAAGGKNPSRHSQ